nr:MAG TPA: hypothetical protein [Caudoviricetes sp.]
MREKMGFKGLNKGYRFFTISVSRMVEPFLRIY